MNILLVGVEQASHPRLTDNMMRAGHSIQSVENERQALVLLQQQPPDIILLDSDHQQSHSQPILRLKQYCAAPFVPIVALTHQNNEAVLARLISSGADDFLNKPIVESLLKAKLDVWKRILSAYRTAESLKKRLLDQLAHEEDEHEVIEKIMGKLKSQAMNFPMLRVVQYSAESFKGNICLVAPNPNGGVNLLIGDFSSQGLTAAIGALPVADAFHKMSDKGYAIEDMLPEFNAKLQQVLPARAGLAACLIQIEADCHGLRVWNGAMPDVLIQAPERMSHQCVKPRDQLLGAIDILELDAKPDFIEISPESQLLIYSKGLACIPGPEDAGFCDEYLQRKIRQGLHGQIILDEISASLERFTHDEAPDDDVTVIAFDCDPEQMAGLMDCQGRAAQTGQKQPTSWELELALQCDTLKSIDPLPVLLQMVTEIQGLDNHREALFTILSELFNNALDHGVLGLDSRVKQNAEGFIHYYQQREQRLKELAEGEIKLKLFHQPNDQGGRLTIIIEDSGQGFDVNTAMQTLEHNLENSGRGVPLVRALCSELRYLDDGNRVRAVYDWRF